MNKYDDHLLIVPEDEPNEEMANGFVEHHSVVDRRIMVLERARGWLPAVESLERSLAQSMRNYPKRRVLLVIDFDNENNRREYVEPMIPADIRDRVFVLGTLSNPEELKAALNGQSYERIGRLLAEDCLRHTDTTWSHPLLEHNKGELTRLREQVRPFLFEVES